MGGHGAWTFAAQQPRFFAAVAVVCGYAQGSEQEEEIARRLARGHSSTAVCVYHSVPAPRQWRAAPHRLPTPAPPPAARRTTR
mmetsp:Transcript_16585/g.47891  ORF Transcript_16585/g.47891 Transcript_16585/m.47891 type:complete len:83 (-) Transcript_16585:2-250(-)